MNSSLIPPSKISNDGREVWSWAHSMAREINRQHEIRTLLEQLRGVTDKCGCCALWMTTICPRETHAKGRRVGPNMNSYICGKYSETEHNVEFRAELSRKIATLKAAP